MSDDQLFDKRWVSIQEVAAELGLDQRTIRRAINDDRIKARRFGRALRVDARSLETYFSEIEGGL